MTDGDWHQMIDTNLSGVFHSLKASVEALKSAKGYYITLASLAGTNFFATGAGYNASKFGVVGFTQAAMLDLRKYDIKVSTIMPGSVATHFTITNQMQTECLEDSARRYRAIEGVGPVEDESKNPTQ